MQIQAYAIDGVKPVVHPDAFVHPQAVLIGDVVIESSCYIGPGACLRGDFSRIHIAQGSNVQENCVLHSFPNIPVIVEPNVIIAHGVILHGCHVKTRSLIGMNSVIMDNAVIGEDCLVAAMSFVAANRHVADKQLLAGNPSKIVRTIENRELDWIAQGLTVYQELVQRCLTTMQPVEVLYELEDDRPILNVKDNASVSFENNKK